MPMKKKNNEFCFFSIVFILSNLIALAITEILVNVPGMPCLRNIGYDLWGREIASCSFVPTFALVLAICAFVGIGLWIGWVGIDGILKKIEREKKYRKEKEHRAILKERREMEALRASMKPQDIEEQFFEEPKKVEIPKELFGITDDEIEKEED